MKIVASFFGFLRWLAAGILFVLKFWPEGLQATGIISGWMLITFGIASLLTWEVWPISIGILVLSFVGWGHLRVVFGQGFYTLSRPSKGKKVNRA